MDTKFRCDCPITSALDVLGDKWILVVIKQMLLEGRQTFKDFTEADEAIATNILTSKLKFLEEMGIVTKTSSPTNRKTRLYHLTEKGLSLTPIIVELALWSDENVRMLNPIMRADEALDLMKADKAGFIEQLKASYRSQIAS